MHANAHSADAAIPVAEPLTDEEEVTSEAEVVPVAETAAKSAIVSQVPETKPVAERPNVVHPHATPRQVSIAPASCAPTPGAPTPSLIGASETARKDEHQRRGAG